MAEHHIHALCMKQADELLLAVCPGERGGDGLACPIRQTLVADLPFGKFKPAQHGFIADGLPDTGCLERIAHSVPGIVGGGIDQSVILAPVHVATGFLHRDVVEGEQGAVFAHRLELVGRHDRLGGVRHLTLHVALRSIHFPQGVVMAVLPAVCGVQAVLAFQLGGDALAAAVDEVLVQPPAPLVHIDGNDVQVVAVDVLVLEDKKGLVAVAQLFQILPRKLFHLHVRQAVVGMRIEGDVDDLVPCTHVLRHIAPEVLHGTGDVHPSAAVVEDLVHGEELALALVHLQSVVGECAVQRRAYIDFCDHLPSNSLDSSMTWRINAASSFVHCSSR